MVGIGEGLAVFTSGITAAKAVGDAVKKLSGTVDQEMRNTLNIQIGELIETMREMREQHATLSGRIGELERENRELRDFNIESENYVLEAIGPNSFAYVTKSNSRPDQPKPYFCAQCFDRKVRSILQFEKHEMNTEALKCHACGSTAHKAVDRGPAVMFAPIRRPGLFE